MDASPSLIDPIRDASRRIVRELGFMGGRFAGTDLPPSAVHALIEIGARDGITAMELSGLLRLERSSVSRLLQKLIASGDVVETVGTADARQKPLSLGASGRERLSAIHAFARQQVSLAMARLRPEEARLVADGLRLYADALGGPIETASGSATEIVTGYRTGLIARVTEMHADYYARTAGFGQRFETVVATGLAHFCERLDRPANQIWLAVQEDRIVGSLAIDGEDMGEGVAHLRWFILDDAARGQGLGRKLLLSALRFVDDVGFPETQLWTFFGLDAARRLYEANGFRCVEERPGDQWGSEVLEQRFVRKRPG